MESKEILIVEQAHIETERTRTRQLVENAAHEAEDIFKAPLPAIAAH